MREIVAVYVLDRGICQPTQDVGNEVLQDPVQIFLRVNVPQHNRFFEIPSIEGDHKVVDDVFGEKTLLNQERPLSLNQSRRANSPSGWSGFSLPSLHKSHE